MLTFGFLERRVSPPLLLLVAYSGLIAIGGALLKLPVAANISITWSDAIFMAASAVTVTGLVVVDPGTDLSVFGQAIIMLLIQLGGLGLMTFAVIVLSSLGLPVGLTQKAYLREDMGRIRLASVLDMAWVIFRIVVICELVGMALLANVFVPEYGWREGLWQAAFHSVSAFNNAGFSLFSDSLMGYVGDPVVNLAVTLLFIVGGLGFFVLSDVFRARRWRRFSLHTRIMLTWTPGLILVSCLVIGLIEWNNPATLGSLSGSGERLWATWFQAVTPRTAGFNSIDTAGMHDSSTLFTMVLMVIGGGSTSTAGGIKVTTFAVLVFATLAFFRSHDRLHVFGFAIGPREVIKVMALLTVSLIVLLCSIFALVLAHEGEFLDYAFEAVSAFGTVGLSRGVTGELDTGGRIVICLLMFLGRVGPLTLGFFLARKTRPLVKYPEGEVYLG